MKIQSQWLDQIPYKEALSIQEREAAVVAESGVARLLGLEHPTTLSLGVRADLEKDLLSEFPFETVRVKRGGEATIHNPGQLVIYPIVPLRVAGVGVREFVERLMLTTEKFFSNQNLKVFRKEEPGLYTEVGKIAFFGIQVSKGISRHGLAINISNELEIFNSISVCGIRGENLDRLKNYNKNSDLKKLFQQWCDIFSEECRVENDFK